MKESRLFIPRSIKVSTIDGDIFDVMLLTNKNRLSLFVVASRLKSVKWGNRGGHPQRACKRDLRTFRPH